MTTQLIEKTIEYELLQITKENEHYKIFVETKKETIRFLDPGSEHQLKSIKIKAYHIASSLPSHRVPTGHISFMEGKADTINNIVKLANGLVMISEDFRGLGIGSFMFYLIVKWAKELDPSTKVGQINVSSVDATEDNRERRNKFYANFGIIFDAPMNKGVVDSVSKPMTVNGLICHQGWSKKLNHSIT